MILDLSMLSTSNPPNEIVDSNKSHFCFCKSFSTDTPGVAWTGEIPTEIGLLHSQLRRLSIEGAKFSPPTSYNDGIDNHTAMNSTTSPSSTTATIPTEIYQLTALRRLRVVNSNVSGTLSNLLGRLQSLVELDFSHNQFLGSIPTEISTLSNLEILDLSSNRLTGDIPKELCALTNLQTLKLTGNADLVTFGGNEIELPMGEGNIISISDLCQGV